MTIKLFAKTKVGFWVDSSIEIFTFPGGEPHARDNDADLSTQHIAQLAIVTQRTMHDLWALSAWAEVAHSRGEQLWVAMPYVPFARADRGVPVMSEVFKYWLYARAVDRFVALDVHSEVMEHYLNAAIAGGTSIERPGGVFYLDLPELVAKATKGVKYDGVIAPDKGAVKRAQKVGAGLGDLPVYLAGKTRDFATGKLTGFHMEDELPTTGRFLLVDDICDGGGTFVGLADAIAATNPDVKLDLWVSHGVFSKGLDELLNRFDNIYTTNSFFNAETFRHWKSLLGSSLHVTDLTPYLFKEISQ